ncbi:PIN domain-containing protein [Streptomyces niveus]|uniref:PIN domain-containing protein n=1 Tax=Streptomyces niveus TaxID=193462 RepID=UPI0036D2331B
MIILDSNILKGTSLRGPEAELLRVIRTAGVENVVAPWIVLEELAAQQALAYEAKYEAAEAAVLKLKAATPWAPVPLPRRDPPERVRDHWRGRYAEIVGTLPTSASAYEQALFREANLLAPCKTVNSGKHKTGARDAAIWLTAVEYAREHPQEPVYFVSNNTEDFGDGTSFQSPMNEDLDGLRDRFVLFTSLDGVLTKFAAESPVPEEELTSLLKLEESLSDVARLAIKSAIKGRGTVIEFTDGEWREVMLRRWIGKPVVDLGSVSDIRSHEIDGHQWSTVTARWLLCGYAGIFRGRRSMDYAPVACSWETRVLVSPTAPLKGLTVLRQERTTPLSPEDDPKTVMLLLETSKHFADSMTDPPQGLSSAEADLQHITANFNFRWATESDAGRHSFERLLSRLEAKETVRWGDELFDDE